MCRLHKDQHGNVSVILALVIVPVLGSAGMAVDYLRVATVRSGLQSQSDAAVLGAVAASSSFNGKTWIAKTTTAAATQLGGIANNISVDGDWITAKEFKVTASAEVPLTLLGVMPGLTNPVEVRVEAVARMEKSVPKYDPPTVASLDPEASDYNRIYVYCFDPNKKKNGNMGRSQETAIADNAGTSYLYQMPQCQDGEALSYRLYNVRNARTNPAIWDSGSATRYNYYTDTAYDDSGAESYDLGGYSILETVLCNNVAECVGTSQGGIIPQGKERTPQQASASCATGKYMYYGWEDRPPGLGWTDQDYDDIRIVIGCPSWSSGGPNMVRLVK